MAKEKLSETKIAALIKKAKAGKLPKYTKTGKLKKKHEFSDGGGLSLQISNDGAWVSWLFRYSNPVERKPDDPKKGKPDNMGLGPYPRVNLKKAREYAGQQWLIVHEGKDPRQERAEVKLSQQIARGKAITVRQAFDQYFDDQVRGLDKHTQQNVTAWAENYMLPLIGDWPIEKVNRKTILDGLYVNEKNETCGLRLLWKEKNQTGRQVQNHLDRTFRAAISEGSFAGDNPAKWKGGLDQVLPRRNARNIKHHPSLSRDTVPEVMHVLRTIRYAGRWHELKLGRPVPGCLIEFCALTGAREGEVRQAEWGEFDRNQMIWTVPPEHKKNKRGSLRRPITKTMLTILDEMEKQFGTDQPPNAVVFPSRMAKKQSGPIDKKGVNKFLSDHPELFNSVAKWTIHGLRSTLKDWWRANGFPPDWFEIQVDHVLGSAGSGQPYGPDDLLEERRGKMELWDKYLLKPTLKPKVGTVFNIADKRRSS